MELTTTMWILSGLAALMVGFSKSGITGMGILVVPLMASVFPAKLSVGILLPMLLVGDVFAVTYYRRHADWRLLVRLFPWVLPGIAAGYYALDKITSAQLAPFLGILVLVLIAFTLLRKRREAAREPRPHHGSFVAVMGFLAGFTTMLGNAAGPIMTVYLLSLQLKKHGFIGTNAWFFLIINALKIPLCISLGLTTADSLLFNLKMVPLIALGAFLGILVFKWIPQQWFSRAVLILAALAAFRLALSPWLN